MAITPETPNACFQAFQRAWHYLTSLKRLEEVHRGLLAAVSELVKVRAALYFSYIPEAEALELVEVRGHSPMPLGRRLRRGEGIPWRTASEGVYLVRPQNPGGVAYLGLAVRDPEGSLLGVLSLYLPEDQLNFSSETVESLRLLAEATGIILTRTRAIEQAQAEARRSEMLLQLALALETSYGPFSMAQEALRILLKLTPYHGGAFFLLEEGRLKPALLVGHYPPDYPKLHEKHPIHEGTGLAAHPGLWRGPVYVQDYARYPHALEPFVQVGLRSILTAPVRSHGKRFGILALASFEEEVPFRQEDQNLIHTVAKRLEEALERYAHMETLKKNQETILQVLSRILEYRHLETSGHAKRVVELSLRLGQAVGFPDLEGLGLGAYLHDLGKVALPDDVLNKNGPLVTVEWHTIKSHPEMGYEILRDIGFQSQTALNVVLYHHERWDGSGYPKGLKGEEIPLEARIFALADVYDALTHERPYKPAWSPEEAKREIREKAGKDFDPSLVWVFLDLIP
jgi:putative nucleotidyltransferase with HDIG domain